jgi:hypothetical protein
MARVAAVVADLLLGSKVDAMLEAAGHEVTLAPALADAPLEDADIVVADLDAADPRALAGLGIPVLGYYSHVDTATREAAEAAGISLAVPRSRMARELPQLVEGLLGGGPAQPERLFYVQRLVEQAVVKVPRGPLLQHGRIEG